MDPFDAAQGKQKFITVETIVHAPMERVWECWTKPEHITHWAFAQDDWEAPSAENDVRVGGKFKTVMRAKDKSSSFDFAGVYTNVKEHELIEYDMERGPSENKRRHVKIEFAKITDSVKITEPFEPENENPEEMQKSGWQAILDNFKKYAEKS